MNWYIFFFQAEDGIRDYDVTGVQTCALPIYEGERVLEDINLSLIGGGESRSLHLGIAQIVREAETGRNQIFPP